MQKESEKKFEGDKIARLSGIFLQKKERKNHIKNIITKDTKEKKKKKIIVKKRKKERKVVENTKKMDKW